MKPHLATSRERIRPGELLRRLRGRPDSEHEMSFNRVGFAVAVLIAVLAANPDPGAVGVLVAYCIGSTLVFIQIAFDSAVRPFRRLGVMAVDFLVLSYAMHANGAYAAGFWPIYLWVIFGNGFRFGIAYLYASAGTAIICFAAVIATTPFWRDLLGLSIGLTVGLIALPAYAGQLISKLSAAKLQAEEANMAKSYFLASVSHELRTPLTAILGLGAHLQKTELSPDQKGMAETIVTAGRSLLALINQLLDYSRLGVNSITTEMKPFDLMRLLLSVRELMQVTAQAKGLEIHVHVDPRTPLILEGDEGHLRDILVNLAGNAIKFTEQGSITFSASSEPQADGTLMLRLAVTDTGIGIAPEAQEHIFESFRQADNTIIDRFGGTGLGLAICKQLAELLGGGIGVVSAPGAGSRFWFTSRVRESAEAATAAAQAKGELLLFTSDDELSARFEGSLKDSAITLRIVDRLDELAALVGRSTPNASVVLVDAAELAKRDIDAWRITDLVKDRLAVALVSGESPEPSQERAFITAVRPDAELGELRGALQIGTAAGCRLQDLAADEPTLSVRRPLRVLVADDNAINQKVFDMILRNAGHSTQSARDGESALDAMRDYAIDIVLMDVNMPVLNGIEATKLYRFASLGRKRIPIIGITADASPETYERCIEAGMDTCVSKPIEASILLKLIDDLVEDAPADTAPTHDPKGIVTPLFPPSKTPEPTSAKPPINRAKLADLEDLGGREFVVELLNDYVADAANLLAAVRSSVETASAQSFRDGTHALRSSAANVGADSLAELCLGLQRISSDEFQARAREHLAKLEIELERVRQALTEMSDINRSRAAG